MEETTSLDKNAHGHDDRDFALRLQREADIGCADAFVGANADSE